MKFKKYILFQFETYYPSGGLGDITDSYDTLAEAQAAAEKSPQDYNEVVDRDSWEIVWQLH